jgi:hypothetical protein
VLAEHGHRSDATPRRKTPLHPPRAGQPGARRNATPRTQRRATSSPMTSSDLSFTSATRSMKREKKRKRRYRWWLVITTAHTLSFSSPRACSPPATAQRDRHRPHSLCPPREGGRTKNVVVRSVEHTIVYSQQPHSQSSGTQRPWLRNAPLKQARQTSTSIPPSPSWHGVPTQHLP